MGTGGKKDKNRSPGNQEVLVALEPIMNEHLMKKTTKHTKETY